MNVENYFGFKGAVENFHTFLEGGQSILVHKALMEQIKLEAHHQAVAIKVSSCLITPVSGEGKNNVVEEIFKVTRIGLNEATGVDFATKARRCYKIAGDDYPLIFTKGPGTEASFRKGVIANITVGNPAGHRSCQSTTCVVYDSELDTMYRAFVVKVLPPSRG